MNPIKTFLKSIAFSIALLLAFGIVTHLPTSVRAQSQPPSSQTSSNSWPAYAYEPDPTIGKPDRREAGTTRGPNITALVPATGSLKVNFGTTVSPYPTFVFNVTGVREVDNATLEFSLADRANKEIIYKTIFTIAAPAMIMRIKLPEYANLPALAEEKNYYWSCSLVSYPDPESDTPSKKTVAGWIERIKPSPALQQQLSQAASPRDRAAIYAKNFIWYDALNTTIELRRAQPNDSSLKADWVGLLQSAGLDKILPQNVLESSMPPLGVENGVASLDSRA